MGLKQTARYKFDNMMARGVGAQILLLAVFTAVVVGITVVLFLLLGEAKDDSGAKLAWKSLMHTMDAGTLGGDDGTWTFLFLYLFPTIGGLFIVSALIGVLNQGFGTMLEEMRRGRSVVVEKNHTVILGWGPKVFTLLHELAEANKNVRNAAVVILADKDKVEMDGEIATFMKGKRLRVITRRGSTMSTEDLKLASLQASKAVVVLGDDSAEPNVSDTIVLRTLLAVQKASQGHQLHIVAEVFNERSEQVARMVAGKKAALIQSAPLVSRLLVQTGRQSGLSIVYTELLDFGGCEMYVTKEPKLAGRTFRDAAFQFGTSTLLGIFTDKGQMLLPPPLDHVLGADDLIVTISEDDDTIILDGSGGIDLEALNVAPVRSSRRSERTLVLGASQRLPLVLRELDNYVAPGSETFVYGEGAKEALETLETARIRNMKISVEDGDVTDRDLLEALNVTQFDHILLLSELGNRTQEMADARTTITLLYLRDIAKREGKRVPITSEILEIQSRDLAAVAEADDFIVSNSLVSLMMSQLAESPHLTHVFEELFSPEGYELYVRPISDYLHAGDATYATLCEAAMQRDEIAIGYRLASSARDASASYGVKVNPSKRERVTFTADDKVIVLAQG